MKTDTTLVHRSIPHTILNRPDCHNDRYRSFLLPKKVSGGRKGKARNVESRENEINEKSKNGLSAAVNCVFILFFTFRKIGYILSIECGPN